MAYCRHHGGPARMKNRDVVAAITIGAMKFGKPSAWAPSWTMDPGAISQRTKNIRVPSFVTRWSRRTHSGPHGTSSRPRPSKGRAWANDKSFTRNPFFSPDSTEGPPSSNEKNTPLHPQRWLVVSHQLFVYEWPARTSSAHSRKAPGCNVRKLWGVG